MKEKKNTAIKKATNYVINLEKPKKVELIVASVLTVSLMVAIPVYAWFSFSSKFESLTKVQKPDTLDIRAGHADSIINLDLSDIDVSKKSDAGIYEKYYVFTVVAGDVTRYDIQIAHTTNIPFTYELYRATESTTKSGSVVEYPASDENTYYYSLGESVGLVNRNGDGSETGRQIAVNTPANLFYNHTYTVGNAADTPEIYAVPLYAQTQNDGIATNNSEHDYFILKLTWDVNKSSNAAYAPYNDWNYASNNKETDIIYISVRQHV